MALPWYLLIDVEGLRTSKDALVDRVVQRLGGGGGGGGVEDKYNQIWHHALRRKLVTRCNMKLSMR